MELKILDSILHDELKPWLLDISDKKKFSAVVKTAKAVSPGSYVELQKQLSELLSDFSALQKSVNEKPPTANAAVQKSFYEIALPKFNDAVTEFFALLIQKESLRLSNLLVQQVSALNHDDGKIFVLKQALKGVRALATQVARELSEIASGTTPIANKELTEFALLTLKQMLTALFFEIQERNRYLLSDFETEESFCISVLNENYSGIPQLKPTAAFFEFQIQKFISASSFDAAAAVDLLKQMQTLQEAKLQTLQAALENLIFLHSQNTESSNPSLDQLTNPDFTTQHFSLAKKSITQEINQLNYGHQRLEVVNTALGELDYILATPINKLSAPQKLYFWLQENKIVYSATASQFYSVEDDAEEELHKGTKPKNKKGVSTAEQQKQVAAEHLKYFSGANLHNDKIMSDEAFQRMMNYVSQLIDTDKLPKDIKPIQQINLPTFHIRYTFYLLHKTLFGTKRIKQHWIDFLHKVFSQFKDTEPNTTKIKFSVKPSSYDSDVKLLRK